MTIEFSCPTCRQLVRTPDATAGKKGKCPQCRAVVQIPAAPTPTKSSAPSKAASRNTPAAPKPAARGPERPSAGQAADAPIEFPCVQCGELVRTPASAAGKKGKCPHCRAVVDIPKNSGSRGQKPDRRPQYDDEDDLVELPDLAPLDDLGPLAGPLHGRSAPAYQPPALPDLTPLLDEVAPTLPSLPQHAGGLPTSNPFAAGSQPRRFFSDEGRKGLPWEREPSTDSFFETFKLVVSAPQDAFEMMRRSGGIGNPFGYLLLSSVLANFLVVAWSFVLEIARALIFWGFSSKGEPLTIHWDAMVLGFGMVMCLGICLALGKGTMGGLFSAAIYHLCLLIVGGAGNGFQATYRAVAFGGGSVYMLIAIPIFGPMFMMVMHFVVLTYAFKNAHATTSTRAFFATLIPTMFWICGACGLLLLNAAVILNALKEGYGH